jgi:phosphatidylserine/phosphatidylglycerophosphate/cardiolipin synthase-like enzyme
MPEKKIEPWRDTGVKVRGPLVADIEQAFAKVWAVISEPIPKRELASRDALADEDDTALLASWRARWLRQRCYI